LPVLVPALVELPPPFFWPPLLEPEPPAALDPPLPPSSLSELLEQPTRGKTRPSAHVRRKIFPMGSDHRRSTANYQVCPAAILPQLILGS